MTGLPGRNTPACAGNTLHDPRLAVVYTEHPRLRGEHSSAAAICSSVSGTPPLARGTRRPACGDLLESRNTPACAGNTSQPPCRAEPGSEHPRLRGEHAVRSPAPLATSGTPPLARGTRAGRPGRASRPRNTPACAGNTTASPRRGARAAEHPRLRGEHSMWASPCSPTSGTPPLARGTLMLAAVIQPRRRNTPACAGNTLSELRC